MKLLVKPEILTSCIYIYVYIYIYGPAFGKAESRLFIFAAQMFQRWMNAESYPVARLYANTLLATKVTLITDGI
jgi:hypothetical protein